MKKILTLSIIFVLSCNSEIEIPKNKISPQIIAIDKPKENSSKLEEQTEPIFEKIVTNESEITKEMMIEYIRKKLEVYNCIYLNAIYDDEFKNKYLEFENFVRNTNDINTILSKFYIIPYKNFEFKCTYCETETNFLKNLNFDLSGVKTFYVKKDGSQIYLMRKLDNYINSNGTVREMGYILLIQRVIAVYFKINNQIPYSCKLNDFYIDNNDKLYLFKSSFNINTPAFNFNKDDKIETLSYLDYHILTSIDNYIYILIRHTNIENYSSPYSIIRIPYSEKDDFNIPVYNKSNKILFTRYFNNLIIYPSLGEREIFSYPFDESRLGVSEIDTKTRKVTYRHLEEIIDKKANNNLKEISDMKTNSKNEIIILDSKSNIIWKLTPFSKIEILAGTGNSGYKDGLSTEAEFNNATLIDIDNNDNIYVLDKGNKAIRKISNEGNVSTYFKQTSDKIKVKY